jgi:proteasome alpha subunit
MDGIESQHQAMGYDRTATLFSPEGRLLQVEYAEKTVRLGSASMGMVCTDGVAIIADKRLSDPLLIPESAMKIYEVDDHIIASTAGILSDSRILMEKAQNVAQQNRIVYDEPIDVESVIREIANLKQAYTQYGGVRPFGLKVIMAGVQSNKACKVFASDVTGNYFGVRATAIGENDEKILEILRKEYKDTLTTEKAVKLALNIFKRISGKNFDITKFEACVIDKDSIKIKRIVGTQLAQFAKFSEKD